MTRNLQGEVCRVNRPWIPFRSGNDRISSGNATHSRLISSRSSKCIYSKGRLNERVNRFFSFNRKRERESSFRRNSNVYSFSLLRLYSNYSREGERCSRSRFKSGVSHSNPVLTFLFFLYTYRQDSSVYASLKVYLK